MDKTEHDNLPAVVSGYIDAIIKKMRYRNAVRAEVRQELADHFSDALADCNAEHERDALAREMIEDFGDAKLLGVLLRRAKKRCRPWWLKTFAFTFKFSAIVIALLALRIGFLASGQPAVRTDYVQQLREQVRDGRDETLNAWHDYQEVIGLMAKVYPTGIQINSMRSDYDRTEQEWRALETFWDTESQVVEAFRKATKKPYFWNNYEFLSFPVKSRYVPWPTGTLPLSFEIAEQKRPYKEIAARILYGLIPLEVYKGNTEQAVDDCIAVYRFSKHLMSGFSTEQLTAVAIEAWTMYAIRELVIQTDLTADEMCRLQQAFEADYNPVLAEIDLGLDKLIFYDYVQRSFTDDGRGNGRPLFGGTFYIVNDYVDYVKGFWAGFPSRKEVVVRIDEAYVQYERLRELTPYDQLSINSSEFFLRSDAQMFMFQLEQNTITRTFDIAWRARATQGSLIGTLAILRFEKENGRFPEDWSELYDNGFLQKTPMDPYSGAPLVYRRTDDGFTLYSVGSNFTDDGGTPGTGRDGSAVLWGDDGDAVFWPLSGD